MALVRTDVQYELHDLIFAKMKGFCEWPALIIEIDTSRRQQPFKVYFYGWGNAW